MAREGTPCRVVIDTDPGVDDALALLLAATAPELEVPAVLTVGGNVPLAQATGNARRILPVAWGGGALPALHVGRAGGTETAEQVHGSDGLGWATTLLRPDGEPRYPPTTPLSPLPAVEALAALARRHPGEITLITLGPLTNVAAAARLDPEGSRQLRAIVVMGGAFRETGNVSPLAEFNIYVDPEAAQTVCEAGVPLEWISLEVTHHCLLLSQHVNDLPDTPRAHFVRDIVGISFAFHENVYGARACFPHDAVAVARVIWPELFRSEPRRVDVETASPLCLGQTVADFRPPVLHRKTPPNGTVCVDWEPEEFLTHFLARLP